MPFVFLSPPDGAAAKRTLPVASTHPAGTDPQPLPESGQAPTGSNHGAEDSAPEKAGADPKKRPSCHPASGKTVPCPGRRFRFRPVIRKPPTGIPGTEPESPHPENRFFNTPPVRSPLSPDNGNDLPQNSLLRKTARPGQRQRHAINRTRKNGAEAHPVRLRPKTGTLRVRTYARPARGNGCAWECFPDREAPSPCGSSWRPSHPPRSRRNNRPSDPSARRRSPSAGR